MSKGWMYILKCANGAFYTGSTKNLELRIQQHQDGEGANFTKKHGPVELVYHEEYQRIDHAFYREKQVQGWSRKKKQALIDLRYSDLPSLSKNCSQNGTSTSSVTVEHSPAVEHSPVVEPVETTETTPPAVEHTPVVEPVETTETTSPVVEPVETTETTSPAVELVETTETTSPTVEHTPVVEPVETSLSKRACRNDQKSNLMIQTNYNPDVLSCLANLSNDEVFTPPSLVNDILDLLPVELWSNPKATFLDPVSKSGVFLREMAKRLMKGLETQIPDKQERINHIFSQQLYGIAITELTSLLSRRSVYCSKIANGKYSICETFSNEQGNILYERLQHTWASSGSVTGKCTYCGASQEVYDREDVLETYAYNFIHFNPSDAEALETSGLTKIFNMKFDVIVGNPPYQLSDGGNSRSAGPIYQKFVQQAKKLNPKYLIMILPARWYAGGKGLDDFRAEMLSDKRIRKLVDFENSNDVFPGVDVAGGICYFLWDRDNKGLCELVNLIDGKQVKSERELNEFPILIRHSQAIPIIRKVLAKSENDGKKLSDLVSSRKPFGLPTNYVPQNSGIPCWFIQRIGLKYANKQDITDDNNLLDKWKFLAPKAPIAGQTDFSKPVGFYYGGNTRISKPGECCTESFIVLGAFSTEKEVLAYKSYIFTKVIRFLLLQTVVSQDVTRNNFQFIPDLGKYEGEYNDEILRQRWEITDEEWLFIDSKIRNIGENETAEIDE